MLVAMRWRRDADRFRLSPDECEVIERINPETIPRGFILFALKQEVGPTC